MKKLRLFLLLTLAVVLCPKISKAQMQSIIYASTERHFIDELSIGVRPIKVLSIERMHSIVTLGHLYDPGHPIFHLLNDESSVFYNVPDPYASVFLLTKDGTTTVKKFVMNDYKITDFDIDSTEEFIYFCGKHVSTQKNFVSWCSVYDFINNPSSITLTIHIIPTINGVAELSKLKTYINPADSETYIAMIARNDTVNYKNFFINMNLYGQYEYFMTDRYHLLDVVATANKIGVLGMTHFNDFEIFSHDKQNIDNYKGANFFVGNLHDNYIDPRVHFTTAAYKDDHVVVEFARYKPTLDVGFSIVNLNSLQNLTSQQVIINQTPIKLLGAKFNEKDGRLYSLMSKGNDAHSDFILETYPYTTYAYSAEATIPYNNIFNCNLLSNLTLYNNNQEYIVMGKSLNMDFSQDYVFSDRIYWFDKKINTSEKSCHYLDRYHINIIPPIHPKYISYSKKGEYSSELGKITLTILSGNYIIKCQ